MTCGEIYWTDFGTPYGSEPGYRRPSMIIQNDLLNQCEIKTTIVIPITSNLEKADFDGNIYLSKDDSGLPKDSVLLGSQIVTVDKTRIKEKAGNVPYDIVQDVIDAVVSVLG